MTSRNLNSFSVSQFLHLLLLIVCFELCQAFEKVSLAPGTPLIVHISISLRNILDIDELRQIITLETTMRLYWQDPRLNVTHLLPSDRTNLEDYILLHPDAAKYIWFPDIYIGRNCTL